MHQDVEPSRINIRVKKRDAKAIRKSKRISERQRLTEQTPVVQSDLPGGQLSPPSKAASSACDNKEASDAVLSAGVHRLTPCNATHHNTEGLDMNVLMGVCADCLKEGSHMQPIGNNPKLYRHFCCRKCPEKQRIFYSDRLKDKTWKMCNKCVHKKEKEGKGYHDLDANRNKRFKCIQCARVQRIKSSIKEKEALQNPKKYLCVDCKSAAAKGALNKKKKQ